MAITSKTFYTYWRRNAYRFYVDYNIVETATTVTYIATDIGIEISSAKATTLTFKKNSDAGYAYMVSLLHEFPPFTGIFYERISNKTFNAGKTSLASDLTPMTGKVPFTFATFNKNASARTEPSDMTITYRAFNFVLKKGSTTSQIVDDVERSREFPDYEIPALGAPMVTLDVARNGSNATVTATVESFEGDTISSVNLYLNGTSEGSIGSGTVGSTGVKTFVTYLYNISDATNTITVTATGTGGTSAVATAVIPVKFYTWSVGAQGKQITFGGDSLASTSSQSSIPSNGQFDCYMDANFEGGVTFDKIPTFNSGIGASALNDFSDMFKIITKTVDGITIDTAPSYTFKDTSGSNQKVYVGQTGATFTYDCSTVLASGYKLIGVVGYVFPYLRMYCEQFYVSDNTLTMRIANAGAAISDKSGTVNLLYVKE